MSRAIVAACGLDAASFGFLAALMPVEVFESNLLVVWLVSLIGVAGVIAVKIGLALLFATTVRLAEPKRVLRYFVFGAVGITLFGAWTNISLIVRLATL